ncbi:heparin lyase I family protein [Dactylosporangium sp. CA-052675]|uniref:heparin lyase I family protein n=1 Tax=Dactylosporangium sp. CA-052675 TaxID=3239927 RepID=UPI003D8B3669
MTSRWRPVRALLACALATAGLALAAPGSPAQADPAGVTRTLDWENPADRTVPPPGFYKQSCCGTTSTRIVSDVKRDGGYAARFELNKTDAAVSNGKRSELTQPDSQPANAERWYGFSIYLPSSWVYDQSPEIVSQWHQCDASRCGGGSPPLALKTEKGHWKLDMPLRSQTVDLDAYSTGTWTDWVFHVKWSTGSSGQLEVWRNGVYKFGFTGSRTHADTQGSPYFKFGIYKWDWNSGSTHPSDTTQRVMYYDALRLGDERATFADVDPARSGGGPCNRVQPVVSASASTYEDINPPQYAVDGSLSTRWSGYGFGAYLTVDLGAQRSVCGAGVAWHRGDVRWNDYTIYTSVDGVSYTKAWEGRSSGTTLQAEVTTFPARPARYVRYAWWNNAEANGWASITEATALSA